MAAGSGALPACQLIACCSTTRRTMAGITLRVLPSAGQRTNTSAACGAEGRGRMRHEGCKGGEPRGDEWELGHPSEPPPELATQALHQTGGPLHLTGWPLCQALAACSQPPIHTPTKAHLRWSKPHAGTHQRLQQRRRAVGGGVAEQRGAVLQHAAHQRSSDAQGLAGRVGKGQLDQQLGVGCNPVAAALLKPSRRQGPTLRQKLRRACNHNKRLARAFRGGPACKPTGHARQLFVRCASCLCAGCYHCAPSPLHPTMNVWLAHLEVHCYAFAVRQQRVLTLAAQLLQQEVWAGRHERRTRVQ